MGWDAALIAPRLESGTRRYSQTRSNSDAKARADGEAWSLAWAQTQGGLADKQGGKAK